MLPEYFIKHYNYTISNNTFTTPDNYYKLLESILNDYISFLVLYNNHESYLHSLYLLLDITF